MEGQVTIVMLNKTNYKTIKFIHRITRIWKILIVTVPPNMKKQYVSGCNCVCSKKIPREKFAELRKAFQALFRSEQDIFLMT